MNVRFEHAAPRRFDLVVGADGLHSTVRRLGFGPDAQFEKPLGYCTAAFSVDHYRYRDEGAYVTYTIPGRQVARYALRDGRSAFFFVFAGDDVAPPHDVAAQQAQLRSRFAGQGWECDEILAAMSGSRDFYFDIVAQAHMPAWCRGRIALVGDAAYCPSLLAGQGSAFAMAGAYLLAYELAAAGGDHALAFGQYQQRFRSFIERKQRAARWFGWWFAPRTAVALWVRNAVTGLMNMPILGRWFAARSFADRFDLPPAEPERA